MKKKWISWLLISLAALLVVSLVLWLRYGNKLFYKNVFVDSSNQISFAYPEEWTIITWATNPYIIATVASPDIGEYTPVFNVTRESIPVDMSLDTYVNQTLSQLHDVIREFNYQQPTSLNIDWAPARKVLFSGKYLDHSFSREQVYTLKGSTIYVMTYLAPVDNFTGNRDSIDMSFQTFSFR